MSDAPPGSDCPHPACTHPLHCQYHGCLAAPAPAPVWPAVEDFAAIAARLKQLLADRSKSQ